MDHYFVNILRAIIFGSSLGFFMSIPIGPSGVESVKRTMASGYKEGLTVSLGAITADLVYLLLINEGLFTILSASKKTEVLFWLISGILLFFIGFNSLKKNTGELNLIPSFLKGKSQSKSIPFITGFVITFTNPMTPTIWITLSGTVIHTWRNVSKGAYYTFIVAIILGMIAWFAILNYLALKGVKFLKPKTSQKANILLIWAIILTGIVFIAYGLYTFITIT